MNLIDYVKQVSQEDFGLPFKHQAVWNRRLSTTGGRFFPKDGHLDFNPAMYDEFGQETFRKIVRHELCHYHLYFAGKGYRHADRDFKELLQAVDGLRYAPKRVKTYNYQYQCLSCGMAYQRQRRVDIKKFRCGRCQGRLALVASIKKGDQT